MKRLPQNAEIKREQADVYSLYRTEMGLILPIPENLLQDMHPDTPRGSREVIRSFLRAPKSIAQAGWRRLESAEKTAFSSDGTGVYQFHLFEKN